MRRPPPGHAPVQEVGVPGVEFGSRPGVLGRGCGGRLGEKGVLGVEVVVGLRLGTAAPGPAGRRNEVQKGYGDDAIFFFEWWMVYMPGVSLV